MLLRGSLYSQVLDMNTGVTIITPEESFPEPPKIAYILHGLNAGNGSWSESSMLPAYAKNYNVVFVMPEVGRSYYIDMRYGLRFFTYVSDELPELCARTFSLRSERENTVVIGASMGGYGALKCALTRPEKFGICCAFSSGSLYTAEFLDRLKRIGDWEKVATIMGRQRVADIHAIFGDDFRVEPENELSVVAERTADGTVLPRVYSACGTDDGFLRTNRRFREDLLRLGYDVTYEEWKGGHDWDFFNEALKKALAFCYGEIAPKPFQFVLPGRDD